MAAVRQGPQLLLISAWRSGQAFRIDPMVGSPKPDQAARSNVNEPPYFPGGHDGSKNNSLFVELFSTIVRVSKDTYL